MRELKGQSQRRLCQTVTELETSTRTAVVAVDIDECQDPEEVLERFWRRDDLLVGLLTLRLG